jgi:hypothetical protein
MNPGFFSLKYQKQVFLDAIRGPEINGKHHPGVAAASWILSIAFGVLFGALYATDHSGLAMVAFLVGCVAVGLLKSITISALTKPKT